MITTQIAGIIGRDTTSSAIEIVLFSIVVSFVGLFVLRRVTARLRHEDQNAVVSLMLGIVGSLYSILIAFVVVQVWTGYITVKETTETEATTVANLLHYSSAFASAPQKRIQDTLLSYCDHVADVEWNTLGDKEVEDTGTEHIYDNIWTVYRGYKPQDPQLKPYYYWSLYRLGELGTARDIRISHAKSIIPGVLWVVLLIGAVVNLFLISLFWTSNKWMHKVGVICFGGLVGFVFYVMYALDTPFSGNERVPPEPFHEVVTEWRHHVEFSHETFR